MISYNPKEWFTFIFKLHKADTVRKLAPLLLGIVLYSTLVAYLELEIINLSKSPIINNIPIVHSLLGFVISLLLVFRTNTAYDRWWEGRKLWGSLVNNSRNLSLKLHAILPVSETEQRSFFKTAIPAFAKALHYHLRKEQTRISLFDNVEVKHKTLQNINVEMHVPNQLASAMYQHMNQLYIQQKISGEQLIYLNSELQSFTDICGACERIKNTPIPFSYSAFIKKFIFIYIITLPIGYVFQLGYLVVPMVAFIFYVLASLEIIAEEIEDPFSGDSNDVPTEKLAQAIESNVKDIFETNETY